MSKFSFLLSGSLLLFIMTGCTTVKRFKTAQFSGEDNTLVDVELFNARLSPETVTVEEKNLWTLSANAQTRLVQILDERYPDNEQFMDILSGSFGSDEVTVQELTRKDLRMVFSISRGRDYSKLNDASGRFSPADRIEYLRLGLEIPESYHLRFHEWNRYATEYGEIDIADVSFSRSMDLSLEGSPAGADMGYDAGVARNEKQVISNRYLKLNGRISDHRIVIESEGNREVDLTGNVIIDVSLEFEGFPEMVMIPVYADAGDGSRASEAVTLKFVDTVVPAMEDAPDTLFAVLSIEYIYRHAASGGDTFAEWDDKVEYYQGQVSRKVPLFLKKDYLPKLFCIGTDQGVKRPLKFRRTLEKEYLLQFMDYRDASGFLEWLQNPARRQTEPVFIGSHMLLYEGVPITPGEVLEKQLKVLPVY
jgi:hypothetical protein